MPIHYLTLDEIYDKFKAHITKKEVLIQREGSTITVNSDQIVIISDSKFSKSGIKESEYTKK
jgi:hypothetical protein